MIVIILPLPTNWLYNFVRRQKLKYFGHVTRHDGLEKTITSARNGRREKKPRKAKTKMRKRHHRYDGSSKQSGRGQASISQRHLGSDVLTRICSETSGQRRPDEDMLREDRVL